MKKVLFLGFGKLAKAAVEPFLSLGYSVTAVARSALSVDLPITYWRGDICSDGIQQKLMGHHFDLVVITLTPAGRSPEDYRSAYFDTVSTLIKTWQNTVLPQKIFYVSSTRVYGQTEGWIDDDTPAEPICEQGKILSATEDLLLQSDLDVTIIRFSGIYGAGRNYLIRQVQQGDLTGNQITNRIHQDDCIQIFTHLAKLWGDNKLISSVYLASDLEPAASYQVKQWINACLNKREPLWVDALEKDYLAKGKYCKPNRLLCESYQFKFPTYREGYEFEILGNGDKA